MYDRWNFLSKDLIDTKACNNHSVSLFWNHACLSANRASLEGLSLLPQFFFKFELINWGCGLSMGTANTLTCKVSWIFLQSKARLFWFFCLLNNFLSLYFKNALEIKWNDSKICQNGVSCLNFNMDVRATRAFSQMVNYKEVSEKINVLTDLEL